MITRRGVTKGFTLVEIMIVVAIVMTLATLAISSVLRARQNANEMAAVASCRAIVTAAQNFYSNSYPHVYPGSLSDLISPVSVPPYIDNVLASGKKQGYSFTYNPADAEGFALNASPNIPGRTGSRYFYADETSIIRASSVGQAGPDDPAVE
jgi:prepilin-type N-terminal cleavage/methylation domain-containing protein